MRATGFASEDVLGRDAGESVIPPEERSAFRELLAYLWKTGFSSPRLGHWMTADGGRRLVSWSNRLLVDATGEPLCLVTSGLDLTGRVRQREEDARALEDDPELRLAQVGRLAQEQRALRRVATLVASEASPEQVFMVVSEESARVLDVDAVRRHALRRGRRGRRHGTPPPRRHRHVPPRRALPARRRELAGPRAAHRRAGARRRLGRALRRDGPAHGPRRLPLHRLGADRGGRPAVGRGRHRLRATPCRRRARRGWAPSASSPPSPSRAPRPARTCTPPARASSRPATSSAAAWSATCTTARSSASCRSR